MKCVACNIEFKDEEPTPVEIQGEVYVKQTIKKAYEFFKEHVDEVHSNETFDCPIKIQECPPQSPFYKDKDNYLKGTCTYCGSLPPDKFMEGVRNGAKVVPTDKNYKAYIDCADGRHKFYFEHLSEEQKIEFVEMLNSKSINIGYPGHFYRLPYFIK
jgi:hypothetical protein